MRVVAATNRDLRADADAGTFRRDLFFRLAVFPIEIPPLRARGTDAALLAQHFAHQFGTEMRGRPAILSEASRQAINGYHWPGNVRELENALERACILADGPLLEPRDLGLLFTREPEHISEINLDGPLSEAAERAVQWVEKRKIRAALHTCAGHKTRAAEILGVSYKTLLTKIKDYDL